MNDLIGLSDLANEMSMAMTVKQVAEALGTAESTIRNKASELFPDIVHNGIATLLSEEQVFEIKENLVPRDLTLKSKVDSALTSLDIEEMTAKVLAYHIGEVRRLRSELAIAAHKIESFDALMRSENTMSITDAAKHFNLHPRKEVFPYLFARGYLTRNGLPTQDAIDADYLSLREAKCEDGEARKQAVVETRQLETWRTRVVPQIKAWVSKDRETGNEGR